MTGAVPEFRARRRLPAEYREAESNDGLWTVAHADEFLHTHIDPVVKTLGKKAGYMHGGSLSYSQELTVYGNRGEYRSYEGTIRIGGGVATTLEVGITEGERLTSAGIERHRDQIEESGALAKIDEAFVDDKSGKDFERFMIGCGILWYATRSFIIARRARPWMGNEYGFAYADEKFAIHSETKDDVVSQTGKSEMDGANVCIEAIRHSIQGQDFQDLKIAARLLGFK